MNTANKVLKKEQSGEDDWHSAPQISVQCSVIIRHLHNVCYSMFEPI